MEICYSRKVCGTVPTIQTFTQDWEQYFDIERLLYLAIDEARFPIMFLFGMTVNLPEIKKVLATGDQKQLPFILQY